MTLTGRLIIASATSAIAPPVTTTVTLPVTVTVTLLVTVTAASVAPRSATTVAIALAADGSGITAARHAESGEPASLLAAADNSCIISSGKVRISVSNEEDLK